MTLLLVWCPPINNYGGLRLKNCPHRTEYHQLLKAELLSIVVMKAENAVFATEITFYFNTKPDFLWQQFWFESSLCHQNRFPETQ